MDNINLITVYETLHDLPIADCEGEYFFKKGDLMVKFPFSEIVFHANKTLRTGFELELLQSHQSIRVVSLSSEEIQKLPRVIFMKTEVIELLKEKEIEVMMAMQDLKNRQSELKTLREISFKLLK